MTTLSYGHPNNQGFPGVDDTTLTPAAPTVTGGLMAVAGYVWNTVSLSWVKGVQSSGGGGGGGGLVQIQDSAGNNLTSTAGSLNVNVTGGGGGGGGSVTQGTTPWVVSGTVAVSNFPATQPVSGTVAVSNVSFPVTGTFWQATQPVSLASPVAVTGTFYQTTQPVSIASMPSTPVTGTFWQATQPVSGTFWQATQPVSIASMPSTPVTGTFWQTTQPVSMTSTTITGTVAVTPPTLTKGTQAATGFSVQNLKDAGRNQTNYFMAAQVVSTATEALQSLTGYKSGAAVVATTTPAVVTTGKTYRVQSITITYVGIATAGAIQVNLRANTAGVVAIGSPLVASWLVGEAEAATAAIAGGAQTIVIPFPDGMEFAAGTGIGVTVLGVGATGTAAITGYAKVAVTGYEY